MKKFMKLALAATACAICLNTAVFAAAFKDVPASHWAFQSISSVADGGLMMGDTAGNFSPDSLIDKFETAKILARAAGYKNTGVTEAELTNYNLAYEKNKSLLSSCAKAYSKWNSTADRELAFLLEKEIMLPEDLNQFVIKDAAGTEKLRALSREEAAVFLVRLTGAKNDALTQSQTTASFKDDAAITAARKPYVYYLKGKGVVAGDTSGSFNPNTAVNRAVMAVLLDKTLALAKDAAPAAQTAVSSVSSVTGTFDTYYAQLGALQITLNDGSKKIYKLSADATVYVDGYLKTAADLRQGMSLVAVVVGDETLMDVKAVSPATATAAPTAAPQTEDAQKLYVEGAVAAVAADAKTVDVEVRMLNPRGEIITETRKFTVPETAQILRADASVELSTIVKGDVVRVDYNGSAATKITVEEKDRAFSDAELAGKKYVELTETAILVLKDADGKTYDLRVTGQTVINRNGQSGVAWSGLRLGDKVSAKAEYDALLSVNATGTRSEAEGVVQEIHITKNSSGVVFLNAATNMNETYGIITDKADMYALRLGEKVRLTLDSKEIESFTTLSQTAASASAESQAVTAPANSVTGYILSNSGNVIKLSDSKNGSVSKEVKYDVHTIATNVSSGSRVNPASLAVGQKVLVEFTSSTSTVAQSISILTD